MNSGRRAFLIAVGLGVAAHLVLGTLVNLVSIYPLYNQAATGTLGDPLPLHAIILTVAGVLALPIDFFVAFRYSKSSFDEGSALMGGAGVSLLAHAIGGFINGLVAFVILSIIYQILQSRLGASTAGLGESYYGLLSIMAAVGLLIGWIVGSLLSAGVGALGAGLGRGRASAKQ